jgi:tape measure domain-containing protein
MDSVVEIVLRLKDMLSGGVRSAASTTQNALGGVQDSVNKMTSTFTHAGNQAATSMGTVTNKLNQVQGAAQGAVKAVTDLDSKIQDVGRRNLMSGRGGGGGVASSAAMAMTGGGGDMSIGRMAVGMALGGMLVSGISSAGSALIGHAKSAMSSGMEAGAIQQQFGVLAGEKQGAELYGNVRQYVKDSVFGPELYGNARTMMAFGIDSKEVMPDMKMLGDVAMGDKQRMDQLTLAFSQTTAAGKLMGQDLLQYVAAGFNPLQEISRKTGKSMATLRDEMSDGKISALAVRQAFVDATNEGGKFHGMLDKMGRTSYGKKQAMEGSIQDAKVSLGQALDPTLGKLLDAFKPMVDKLPETFERIAPYIEKGFGRFEEMLPSMVQYGKSLVGVLKPVADLALSDGVAKLAKSAVDAASSLSQTLIPVIDRIAKMAGPTAGWVGSGLETIRGAIFGYGYAGGKAGNPDATGLMNAAAGFGGFSSSFSNFTLGLFKDPHKSDPNYKSPADYAHGDYSGMGSRFASLASDKKTKGTGSSAIADATDTIVNGGRKQIIVQVNAPMYKVDKQEFHTVQEHIADFESKVKTALLGVLQSANQAL